MIEFSKESVRDIVQNAIDGMRPNLLGLKLAPNGIHEVDGRWWAVIDTAVEDPDRTQVWESVAQLEEIIETEPSNSSGVKVLVTAA